ncbi:MAG: hypothetical protein AAGG81_01555 [Chlamydiota bacterium]
MSPEKPKALHAVGLQIEDHLLKVVFLTQNKEKVIFNELFSIPVKKSESGEYVNPLYIDDQGKKLGQLVKSHLTLTAISGSETLVRTLFVKLKKERDIDSVIEFQSEPILPFDSGDAVVDWMRVKTEDEGSELTIFGVKKEHVHNHLSLWKEYDIEPEVVSTVPAAVLSFCQYFVKDEPTYLFAHVGSRNTTCGLVHEGKLLSGQFLPKGFMALIDAYAEDLGLSDEQAHIEINQLDFTSLDKERFPSLMQSIDHLRMELLKTFYGLAKQMKGEDVKKLFLTGEGGAVSSFCKRLVNDLHMEEVSMVDRDGLKFDDEALKKNAVPIGLALSGMPAGEESLNLRKGELSHPNPLKRLMKPLAIYFISCFMLVVGIFLFGQAWIGAKEDHLKERYGDMLSYMNTSYQEFEMGYEQKTGEYEGEILPIEDLEMMGLFNRLDYLESEIDAAPQPIALMPNTPQVSDVLAWLSTHPNVVLAGDETDDKQSLIHIENFNYSMVKRPDEKKRGNKYQVKVEMEFTSTTPKLAREFHDALIEDNRMVDPKGEVKWSSNRGKYRTSFFLKDRTYYP